MTMASHQASNGPAGKTRRPRATTVRVRLVDRFTTAGITVGGLSVIVAVLGIMIYLVWVVIPLFRGAELTRRISFPLVPSSQAADVIFAELDEYRKVGVYALRSGEIVYFDARTGETIERASFIEEGSTQRLSAFVRPAGGSAVAFGFSDGSFRVGQIGFESSFVASDESTPEIASLRVGDRIRLGASIVEHTASGEMRRVAPAIRLEPFEESPEDEGSVVVLDYRPGETESRLAILRERGDLVVNEIFRQENLMTGEMATEISSTIIPVDRTANLERAPSHLLITSTGDQIYLAWEGGTVHRFDLRDDENPALVETRDVIPDAGTMLTQLRFMLGEQSLLAGDSAGGIRAWFRVAREGANLDGYLLVPAHTLATAGASVTRIGLSSRDKTFLAGHADGSVVLYHMTSEQELAAVALPNAVAAVSGQITPKGDGVFVIGADGNATSWDLRNPHPETTWKSIFGKVWYEGYPEPEHTWQSSSGTDDFEPKFSLVPLIFGTLKATVYSLLFAVPIALLAAICTSEFLDQRFRAPIKSTIEMMASLPSVVLGFIAALVLAPLVENWVVAILTVFAVIPLAVLGSGYLWQVLPRGMTAPLEGRPQLLLLLLVSLGAACLGLAAGGLVEDLMFYGDFKGWLDGRVGSGLPGIAVVVWPFVLLSLFVIDRRFVADALARRSRERAPAIAGLIEGGKFLVLVILSFALAWLIGAIGSALGFDLRGVLFGTYVQRNALVVGFVIGFAVIPIIYTIAEDALSSVPQMLRSASLGCGATRWQTATRVVLPVALSGIFSAAMIGLGRAVGETMIVLMAAGNTPLIDFNIFNGLRTLSANIAVELPEAVKDGTLYRMLFLAALTLFVMTFVVNTLAEIVRQRFRKRAFQL
ncbi:MAG TPA: ABC transporter permease subunit [Thermoanaerobaculia bacterium]|nr:ABC transporter permease subunit [Thermoanaerobaculia bacterium]